MTVNRQLQGNGALVSGALKCDDGKVVLADKESRDNHLAIAAVLRSTTPYIRKEILARTEYREARTGCTGS